jgi:hypothetical protein
LFASLLISSPSGRAWLPYWSAQRILRGFCSAVVEAHESSVVVVAFKGR